MRLFGINIKLPERKQSKHKPSSRFDKKESARRSLMQMLTEVLNKLGYEESSRVLNGWVLLWNARILGVLSLLIVLLAIINRRGVDTIFLFLFFIWTLVFVGCYLLSYLLFFLYLDLRMFQRVKQIEEALPDFLQLTAANISAGMTIDRALWYAVRPKFGILAVEMENIAKSTLTGEDLEKVLAKFALKYDSRLLKESINLLVAGLNSGGEMAGLLNKIATNIKEAQLVKKEIGASVTTYIIFIVVATIIAAPVLFGLSTELLIIIKRITSTIHLDQTSGINSLFSFNFSGDSISIGSFQTFSIIVLSISSFFSAAITSTIRKGTIKDGLKYIPIFIGVSVMIYLGAAYLFSIAMGGLFGS